jgi:thioredoxin 1
MALEITDADIAIALSEKELTVLDFWAPWCAPCRMLSPIIDELSKDNADNEKINIAKVNVDENKASAVKYGIRGIPTVLFIKGGNVVDRVSGLKSKAELQEKINALLS